MKKYLLVLVGLAALSALAIYLLPKGPAPRAYDLGANGLQLVPASATAVAKIDVADTARLFNEFPELLAGRASLDKLKKADTLIFINFGESPSPGLVILFSGDFNQTPATMQSSSNVKTTSYKGLKLYFDDSKKVLSALLSENILMAGTPAEANKVIDAFMGDAELFKDAPYVSLVVPEATKHPSYILSKVNPHLLEQFLPPDDRLYTNLTRILSSVGAIGIGFGWNDQTVAIFACSDSSSAQDLEALLNNRKAEALSDGPEGSELSGMSPSARAALQKILPQLQISSEGNMVTVSAPPLSSIAGALRE